jgi:hypothetical protein
LGEFAGSRSVLLVAAAIVAAAVTVITLNVVLLGWATNQDELVGRLTPRVDLPVPPAWAIRPAVGRLGDVGADD